MATAQSQSRASINGEYTRAKMTTTDRRPSDSNEESILAAPGSPVTVILHDDRESDVQSRIPDQGQDPLGNIEAIARGANDPHVTGRRNPSEPVSARMAQENREKDHSTTQQAYNNISVNGEARAHFGNVYYYGGYNEGSWSDRSNGQGFSFSMDSYAGNEEGRLLFASMSKLRLQHVSTKQLSLNLLVDHVDFYKPYAKVQSTKVRNSLVRIARLCLRLDRLFAALFIHLLQAQGCDQVGELLQSIRSEIFDKYTGSSSSGGRPRESYLGDLGHFCEAILDHRLMQQDRTVNGMTDPAPKFHVTHGTKESFIHYLQDGFEVPYWKMMLDFFSAFRANESTLGSDAVALALISMRCEVHKARRHLENTVNSLAQSEDIDDIVRGIEKRTMILNSFTDRLVTDTDEEEDDESTVSPGTQLVRRQTTRTREEQASSASKPDGVEPSTASGAQSSSQRRPSMPDPSYPNSILTALSIVAILAGMVPFVEGFRIARDSVELGTKQDADYWFTMSSGLTVIFSNLAMVLPLWKGSWTIKTHLITAFWIVTGVACAITSMAIYEGYNTAWSSLLAFFATVAGFAATLSIAMTEEKAGVEKETGRDQESKKDR